MPTPGSNFSRYVIPSPLLPVGTCCICVPVPDSVEYRAQFLGAIWRMSLQTHYQRDTAQSGKVVAARWRSVYTQLVTNMNCCEPSFTELNQTIQNNYFTVQLLMQNIRQLWINAAFDVQVAFYNTPGNFDTDPGDVGDEIASRNRALCLAIEGWIDAVFNEAMSFLEASAADVVPIAVGTAAIPLVGPIISVTIGTALLVFGITTYQQLLDEDYRHYLACAMFTNLKGESTGDRDAWNASLDSFPDPRPQPEPPAVDAVRDIIEEWMRSQINNLDNYLAFVSNLSTAMDIAGQVQDEDCGCLGWVHVFDFTVENDGWVTRVADSRDYGNYVAGVGWVSEYGGSDIGQTDAERLYIEKTGIVDTNFTAIRAYYSGTGNDGIGNASTLGVKDDLVLQDVDIHVLWNVSDGSWVHEWDFNETGDEIEQSIVNPTGADDSEITLTSIVVAGLGDNPFT